MKRLSVWVLAVCLAGMNVLPAECQDRQNHWRHQGQQAPAVRQQGPAPQRAPHPDVRFHQNEPRRQVRQVFRDGPRHPAGNWIPPESVYRVRYRHHHRDGHRHHFANGLCYYCGLAVPAVIIGTAAVATGAWIILASAPPRLDPRIIQCSSCKTWYRWQPAYDGEPTPGLPPCFCWDGYR